MTYQVTLYGVDGVVIASDQCELRRPPFGDVQIANKVKKIGISSGGKYAWAFSGGTIGPVLARHLESAFKNLGTLPDEEIRERIDKCRRPALVEWQSATAEHSEKSEIVFVSGNAHAIFRCDAMPVGNIDRAEGGFYISGQISNRASFLVQRFYSKHMNIQALACLAAHSIRAAHDIDNFYIDGLDVAVYRDSTGRFEFENSEPYWDRASDLDDAVRDCFARHAVKLQGY